MVDIKEGREADNDDIIGGIIWIRCKCSTAYTMRKIGIDDELPRTLKDEKLKYEVENSIVQKHEGCKRIKGNGKCVHQEN